MNTSVLFLTVPALDTVLSLGEDRIEDIGLEIRCKGSETKVKQSQVQHRRAYIQIRADWRTNCDQLRARFCHSLHYRLIIFGVGLNCRSVWTESNAETKTFV